MRFGCHFHGNWYTYRQCLFWDYFCSVWECRLIRILFVHSLHFAEYLVGITSPHEIQHTTSPINRRTSQYSETCACDFCPDCFGNDASIEKAHVSVTRACYELHTMMELHFDCSKDLKLATVTNEFCTRLYSLTGKSKVLKESFQHNLHILSHFVNFFSRFFKKWF